MPKERAQTYIMFVLTIDQRDSSRSEDRVDLALHRLRTVSTRLPFERTAGDEFQGVLEDAAVVVDIVMDLVRDGHWHIGIGAGPVNLPLPTSTRAANGPAFESARKAVEKAKRLPAHLAVRGAVDEAAAHTEAVLALMGSIIEKRSEAAWEAIDLVSSGSSFTEAADKLGVSRQAISQRLSVAQWQQEQAARPAAAALLRAAQ